MAKQHSDHIENRFREAAQNISIPENPEGWKKMEQLLDTERKRRPIAYWWYLLVCLTIGAAGFLAYEAFGPKENLAQSITAEGKEGSPVSESGISASDARTADIKSSPGLKTAARQGGVPAANAEVQRPHTSVNNAKPELPGERSLVGNEEMLAKQHKFLPGSGAPKNKADLPERAIPNGRTGEKLTPEQQGNIGQRAHLHEVIGRRKSKEGNSETASVKNETGATAADRRPEQAEGLSENSNTSKNTTGTPAKASTENSRKENTNVSTQPKTTADSLMTKAVSIQAPANHWNLDKGFSLSFVTQIDATALHHFSLHEFKALYGGAVGYRFSNRLSVQTGFNVQRAIYFAGPNDYQVKAGSYLSMFKIMKIDADCLLYEVPVNARYDMIIGRNFRVYGSAGLNSYFLKKENYKYHLTAMNGMYRMLDSTFATNQNFFSSTYLSIGFEKKITPSFSVQAEPYLKIPNTGIGEGKVKLYSAGMQLSLKFQPAKKHPQKYK